MIQKKISEFLSIANKIDKADILKTDISKVTYPIKSQAAEWKSITKNVLQEESNLENWIDFFKGYVKADLMDSQDQYSWQEISAKVDAYFKQKFQI